MLRTCVGIVLFIFALMFTSACDDACRQLADAICACELNALQQNACTQRVKATEIEITTEDEEVCSALLETCTCAALEDARYDACGLATSPH